MDVITIFRDGGEAHGYVVDAAKENVENYLDKHGAPGKAVRLALLKAKQTVAILTNLMVEEPVRGQGIGSDMVGDFLNQSATSGATCFILIADSGEEQSTGFDLLEWYGGFGFENVLDTGAGPLMVIGDNAIEAILSLVVLEEDNSPCP